MSKGHISALGTAAVISLCLICTPVNAAPSQGAPTVANLTQKARAGDKQAQEDLGSIYIHGTGTPVDYAAARKWYKLAAQQGSAKAQHNLCYLYGAGLGGDKDMAAAIPWCEKAANQGFVKSQVLLGDIYLSGTGVPVDTAAALKWYRMAAEQGDAHAQAGVAHIYANGVGVDRDYETALVWARKSAAQGDANGIKLKSDLEILLKPPTPVIAATPPPPARAPAQITRTPDMQRVYDYKTTGLDYEQQAKVYLGYASQHNERGESKSACERYISAAGFLSKAGSAYNKALTLIYQTHLDDQYDEFRDIKAFFYDGVNRVNETRSEVKEDAAPYCEAAGMKIY